MSINFQELRSIYWNNRVFALLSRAGKTALVLVFVFGPGLVLLLFFLLRTLAGTLDIVVDGGYSVPAKLLAVGTFQAVTLGLLWSLRDAVFLPAAESYFLTLPLPRASRIRADITNSLRTYSVLWLSLAWFVGMRFVHRRWTAATLGSGSILGLLAIGLVLNLLLLKDRPRLAAVVAVLVFPFVLAVTHWSVILVQIVAVISSGALLWRGYATPADRSPTRPVASRLYERLALHSGLAIAFLVNELQGPLYARCLAIAGSFALFATMLNMPDAQIGAFTVLVLLAAIAAIALHSLPDVIRSTVLGRLYLFAAHGHFRRRVEFTANVIPAALYWLSVLGTYAFFGKVVGPGERFSLPAAAFFVLYCLGVVGRRFQMANIIWMMPVVTIVTALVISGFV